MDDPGGSDDGLDRLQRSGAHEGVYALRSETVEDGQSAQVQVSGIFLAAGSVTFRLRISSEANFDFLRFYVDGVRVGQWSGTTVTGWQTVSFPIAAGPRTLRWSYEKDASVSLGQDAAWIDAVTMPAMTP